MCVITLNEDEEGWRRPGNGREGREAAMEGRRLELPTFVARRPVWLATGGSGGDGRARERRLGVLGARAAGLAAGVYPALPHHESGRGTAAPRSVARQSLATSAVSVSGRRHVRPLPRHHAWRGTGIWPRQSNRRGQKC